MAHDYSVTVKRQNGTVNTYWFNFGDQLAELHLERHRSQTRHDSFYA